MVPRGEAAALAELGDIASSVGALLRARGLPVAQPSPAPPREDTAEMLQHIEERYYQIDPEGCLRLVGAWWSAFSEGRVASPSREQLLRLTLLEAMALLALERYEDTDAALRRALAIEPGLALDPEEYSPVLRDRIGRLGEAPIARGGPLSLRASAEGVDTFIDGMPASGEDRSWVLPVGRHVVCVRAPGYRDFVRVIEVGDAPIALTHSASLDPSALGRLPKDDAGALLASARRALEHERLSVLFVERIERAGARAYRLIDAEGAVIASVDPADLPHASARSSRPIAEALLAPTPPVEPRRADAEERAARIRTRRWAWSLGAAAVSALALGLGFGLGVDDRYGGWSAVGSVERE